MKGDKYTRKYFYVRKKKELEAVNENMLAGGYGGYGGIDPTAGAVSYTVQGPSPGYVYSVMPLNNTLQQKANPISRDYYIHPGCTVRGYGLHNPDKRYTGQVYRIVKDSDGAVKFVYIKTIKTNRFVPIKVEGIELINYSAKPADKSKRGKYFP